MIRLKYVDKDKTSHYSVVSCMNPISLKIENKMTLEQKFSPKHVVHHPSNRVSSPRNKENKTYQSLLFLQTFIQKKKNDFLGDSSVRFMGLMKLITELSQLSSINLVFERNSSHLWDFC